MIYLRLFLIFFEVGLFSFGGGYGMISLLREKVIANEWLSNEMFINLVAVSESTPGPIAVNMATFIGSTQGGILGSMVATLGVCLPSFIIILLIVTIMQNVLKYSSVKATLNVVKPTIIALIFTTALLMFLSIILNVATINENIILNWRGLMILLVLIIFSVVYKKIKKSKVSPILLILLSALLGIIIYSF